LTGKAAPDLVYFSLHGGSVLLPDKTVTVVKIPAGDAAAQFWEQAQTARLSIRVCYCSLYGECWLSDSHAEEPSSVGACPAEADKEFGQ
jgi:hypothetical protein